MADRYHAHGGTLRFLFIADDKFPPFRVDVSVLFGEEMVRRGHVIDWLLQSEKPCSASYETVWLGCRVLVGKTDCGTSRLARVRKHLYSIRHDMKMFGLVRGGMYDFIQVRDKFISGLLAILAARAYKTKFVYWLSYPFPEDSLYKVKHGQARYPIFYFLRGWIFHFLLYRIIMPMADHVFVQSEQMKRDIAVMGVPEAKMSVVPMGISLESIDSMSVTRVGTTRVGTNSKGCNVVYLGTLAKVRHLDFLVRAFGHVVRRVSKAKLYLVGDGEDRSDVELIRKEAASLGIDEAVIITGFLPRDRAWAYVRQADVCVSPFYPTPILRSTSPTKLIEYMALAKPVVVNDHPEQRVVIEKSGGGICVSYEEHEFANAIITLLEDPDQAVEMGVRGRHYIERVRTYDSIANQVERDYMRLRSSADR